MESWENAVAQGEKKIAAEIREVIIKRLEGVSVNENKDQKWSDNE